VSPDDVGLTQLLLGVVGGYAAAYALASKLIPDLDDVPAWVWLLVLPITPIGLVPSVLTSIFLGEVVMGIPYGEGGVLKAFLGPFLWCTVVAACVRWANSPRSTPQPVLSGGGSAADKAGAPPDAPVPPAAAPPQAHHEVAPASEPPTSVPVEPAPTTPAAHRTATSTRAEADLDAVHEAVSWLDQSNIAVRQLRTSVRPHTAWQAAAVGQQIAVLRDAGLAVFDLISAGQYSAVSGWLSQLSSVLISRAFLAGVLVDASTDGDTGRYAEAVDLFAINDTKTAQLVVDLPNVLAPLLTAAQHEHLAAGVRTFS
jgi:hypothetical protein